MIYIYDDLYIYLPKSLNFINLYLISFCLEMDLLIQLTTKIWFLNALLINCNLSYKKKINKTNRKIEN